MTAQTARRGPITSARPITGPEPVISLALAAAIYFGLSLLYFLPAFLPGKHLFGTDYLAGGYFFYEFVASRFQAGTMPGWIPYIFGGLPLKKWYPELENASLWCVTETKTKGDIDGLVKVLKEVLAN